MRPTLVSTPVLSLLLGACLATATTAQTKIMPVGGSITEARSNLSGLPAYFKDLATYRYFLWHELKSKGYSADFVGTHTTINAATKPHYDFFDVDHEGDFGWTSTTIAGLIQAKVAAEMPDIMLLHTGSFTVKTDGLATAKANIETIIDEARLANPNITILVAQVIPFAASSPFFFDFTALNAEIALVAAAKTTGASPVIAVDHHTGWDPAANTLNGLHPYEIGELRMAQTWFTALATVMTPVNPVGVTSAFSGTPTSGAAPLSVGFTNSSTFGPSGGPFTLTLWEFGDGTTSLLENPTHVYSTPGTYTVNLTVQSHTSGTRSIHIEPTYITVTGPPAPVAAFSGSPTSGTAPLNVTFTDASTNTPTSWAWTFGDGGTSDVQSPSHNYTTPGTYTVTLIATNAGGSSPIETKTDYISVTAPPAPVAAFSGTPTTGVAPQSVSFTDASTNSPTSWAWTFGDGGTSDAQNPSHSYTTAGTYTVTLTVTNATGSDDETKTDYITITPGAPVADFSGTPTTGVAPQSVSFTDASTNTPTSWAWTFGDGGTSDVQNPSHNYTTPGTYTVTLIATNAIGPSPTETKTDYITINPPAPVAAFSGTPTTGVAPQSVSFTDASTNTPTSWAWTFGDGGTSDAQNPSHNYTTAGTYTVTLTATNATGSDDETKTDYITITPGAPVADFSGTPTTGIAPQSVSFTDASTNTPTSWAWTFGDGGTSDAQSPSHNYTTPGTYTVTLTATNATGSDDETKTDYITINPPAPVAAFSGTPTTGVTPQSVSFTDASTNTPTSWAWTFGDGGTSDAQNPSHNYTTAGTYTVTLTATNATGSDDETKTDYITITPGAPVADFSGTPTTGIAPQSVSFTDASTNTPTSWAWTFGDGGTSDAQSPSHNYTTPGTYTVTLTATNATGSDDETKTDYITINPPAPVAAFSGTPTTGVAPQSVSFTDASTNTPTSWAWTFGDGGTSDAQNPSHNYTTAGTYTVTLTATNATGSDDETKTDYITITPGAPVADFSGTPTTGTAPQSVSFTDASTNTPTSWAWTFGDGGTSDVQNPSHNYTTPGTYTVTLTATNATGSDDETKTDYITINPPAPVAAFSGTPTTGVTPQSVTFTDASTNTPTSWAWTFGDGGTSDVQNPSHNYTTPGTYTVTLTATNATGSDDETKTDYITITLGAPVADFSGTPTTGVAPQSVSFTDASTNTPTSWAWTFGDGGTSDVQNPSHNYTTPGTYSVSLTATNATGSDGETKTDYITITSPVPVADFSGTPTSGSTPLPVSFTDASTNTPTSWAWTFGDGGTSDAQHPSHIYTVPGTYTVSLTATNASGSDGETKTDYITVADAPVADFTGTPTIGGAPLTVNFSDTSTGGTPTSWLWEFGDTNTSTAQNPSHDYTAVGTYTVKLTVTNAGGTDSKTLTDYITVKAVPAVFKIMPVGDSVTVARRPGFPAYANHASYRYFLWHLLKSSGRCADFVGSESTILAPVKTHYNNFDRDHSAKWSDRAEDMAARIQAEVTTHQPDIILLHAGSSDLFANQSAASTLTEIGQIIDNARLGRSDVIILVAKVIPFGAGPLFRDVSALNAGLPALVASRNLPASPVLLVDHNSGWDPAVHSSFDNVHPYEIGELRMATTWNAALASIMPVCGPTGPSAATFSATPTTGFAPLATSFTDTSPGSPTTWLWEFGDGTTSVVQNPSHNYSTPGAYTVNLTVGDAAGNLATDIKTDYITATIGPPIADFSGTPTTGVAPQIVTFTDASTGTPTSWLWEFGDGETSDMQNPLHNYTAPGLYTVKLTATNVGGSDAEIKTDYITVNVTAPVADFSGTPTTGIAPQTVVFTDTSTGAPTSWAWKFGDGGTSDVQNPSHDYISPGTYTVELTVTNTGGSDTETKTDYITVSPTRPVAAFSAIPTAGDAPLSVSFTDLSTSAPAAWLWEFGDGATSTARNPSKIYTAPGSYTVKLTATNASGSDTATKTDYIVVSPSAAPVTEFAGAPTFGGAPLFVSFTDQSTNTPDAWLWEFGDGDTSADQNPIHVYNAPGAFTVKLTATNSKGSNSKTRTDYIVVTPAGPPTADFSGTPTTGDAPLTVVFSDLSTQTPTSWLWDFGDSVTATSQNPSHVYTSPGIYTVSLTATNSKGSDSKTRANYIVVKASEKLRIMPLGDSITEARHGYATYRYFLWNQLKTSIDCADFVGSMHGTQGRGAVGHNGVPKYPNFDQDHEGHWGWGAGDVADNAHALVLAAKPDIVLCHIGSDDMHQNRSPAAIILDMERAVDELRRANPDITIFLAKLIPFGAPFSINVAPLNALLPAMVASKSTARSPIILVDHFTGWIPAIHSIDGVHPNELGETRMANTWYQAMVAHGLTCPAGFSRFGTGCLGSAGIPNLDSAVRPVIGSAFSMEVTSLPANAPVIGITGFTNQTWNGAPLPTDLTFLGMPGCFLLISYDLTEAITANGAGTASWTLPQIPNLPSLAGIHVYFQAAVGDPGVNRLGVTSSNAGDARLGVR